MVLVKRLIGWLCVLSLILSIVFAARWTYIKVWPFFHDARVVSYAYNIEPAHLMSLVKNDGVLDSNDQTALVKYAEEGIEKHTMREWDAALNYILDGIPESPVGNPIILMGLFNKDGIPVAAYPAGKLKDLTRYDGNGEGWRNSLWELSRQYSEDASYPNVHEIRDVGRYVGMLSVSWNDRHKFVVIPEESRSRDHALASTYAAIAVVMLFLYCILLSIWTAIDAGWRGMRPFAWGSLVFLTNWLGLIAYLIARLSPPSPCSNCGELVLAKYKRCPSCGVTLMSSRCPSCRTKLKPGWQYCPVCSSVPSTDEVDAKGASPAVTNGADDELYEDAVDYVAFKGSASTSMLQRHFKIGYTRAAAIIDTMEERGVVGPLEGVHPRQVLVQPRWVENKPADTAEDTGPQAAVVKDATSVEASACLRVKVTSSLTGAPLADVRVRLQGPYSVDGLTSRDGVFQANKLQSGSYQVNVSKAGYESYQTATDVNGGPDTMDLKVRLKPVPGNIQGRVTVAGSGEPMQGARVSIDSSRLDRPVVTGVSGEYSLDDIPPGPYLIRVDAVGYESQTKVAEVSSNRETRLNFSFG